MQPVGNPSGSGEVIREIVHEFEGRRLRIVTRIDPAPPPAKNISAAHCVAFDDDDRVVLALHRDRQWTIPGGHLEDGESAEEAMMREALEEAGAVVEQALLFAHDRIDPEDGVPAHPRYPVPSYQVFFVARLVSLGVPSAIEECSESRLFTPSEARAAPGWMQSNVRLYEEALKLAGRRPDS
jgi:8-oxo-dGTP diphosphatase